jgi:hypothetical protein
MSDFFLGKDGVGGSLLVKADSFTTHAFVLGMTGSGKTGLIISILEEAALAGIPAVVIDPKGDLVDRLLVFNGISEEKVAGFIPEDKRASFVENYKKGIADWDITSEKIEALSKRNIKVFTPGLSLSPVNILERFAPPPSLDEEDIMEKSNSVCVSLLSLTGKKAEDAVREPEGLLLSTILIDSWKRGETITLETLLEKVVDPPLKKLGILPLDTVISKEKRVALAVDLNGVLSSPALSFFKTGDELNLDQIFGNTNNETIFTLAQLSDEQKQFFLGLFLSELYLWVRRQQGSDRLKMLLVFDEVFGFFPPHPSNPPTKQPLLGLLKQARAFGLGVILSTQNPYDVDYKGLSNAGLWFLGRLQTENDKKRVAEGLSGIQGGAKAADLLSEVKQREFVLNDVRKDSPVVFKTRQAISLLVGPLSGPQLKNFIQVEKKSETKAAPREMVIVPSGIEIKYGEGERLFPHILFESEIPYKLPKNIAWAKKSFTSLLLEEGLEASLARDLEELPLDFSFTDRKPENAESFSPPAWFNKIKRETLEKEIKEVLSLKAETRILKDTQTGLLSEPSENRENYFERVKNERNKGFLKQKEKEAAPFLKRKESLEDEIEKRKLKLERLKADFTKRRTETYASVGTGILRGIFGSGRSVLGGISGAMTKDRMADSAKQRFEEEQFLIQKATDDLNQLKEQIDKIQNQDEIIITEAELEDVTLLPFKSGIRVLSLAIVFK